MVICSTARLTGVRGGAVGFSTGFVPVRGLNLYLSVPSLSVPRTYVLGYFVLPLSGLIFSALTFRRNPCGDPGLSRFAGEGARVTRVVLRFRCLRSRRGLRCNRLAFCQLQEALLLRGMLDSGGGGSDYFRLVPRT